MGNAVVHFMFHAQDPERLARFHEALFGWTIRPVGITSRDSGLSGTYRWIDTPLDAGMAGGIASVETPQPMTLGVMVENVDATLERAEHLGATRLGPSEELELPETVEGPFRLAGIVDPEGNHIDVFQH